MLRRSLALLLAWAAGTRIQQADVSANSLGTLTSDPDCITTDNVTIPTVQEAESLKDALAKLHQSSAGDLYGIGPAEEPIASLAIRFAMLAYGRNDGHGYSVRAFTFGNDTEISMLVFQFKSWFHTNGSTDDAAHLVAYLVKVKGGVGVVLSYKGSTNRKDWQANLDSKPDPLFRDSPLNLLQPRDSVLPNIFKHAHVEVHHGFKWHKASLDWRMGLFMMEPVTKILTSWGVPESALHRPFKEFLYSGAWKWCISIGHSLGGAMSSMAALDIAVDSGSSQVYSVVVGSAIPGFVDAMKKYVKPQGGLRIENEGDVVTFLGYGNVHWSRSSRIVHGIGWTLPLSWLRSTFLAKKNHLVYDIGNTTFRMETALGGYRTVDAHLGPLWHYYNKTGILATGDSLLVDQWF